jgi:hypothetical protein
MNFPFLFATSCQLKKRYLFSNQPLPAMSAIHTSVKSIRLTNTLIEAGINPDMFAKFLTTSLDNNKGIAHPSAQEAFEYQLCAIQAQRVILLIAS